MSKGTYITRLMIFANCVAVVGFLFLYFLYPMAEVGVRMKYAELDRAGVINANALQHFHPDHGFTPDNHRNSVPRYIAGPALSRLKTNAIFGLAVASGNLILVALWMYTQKRGGGHQSNVSSATTAVT